MHDTKSKHHSLAVVGITIAHSKMESTKTLLTINTSAIINVL